MDIDFIIIVYIAEWNSIRIVIVSAQSQYTGCTVSQNRYYSFDWHGLFFLRKSRNIKYLFFKKQKILSRIYRVRVLEY